MTEEVHHSDHQRERNFDSSFNPFKFFYSPKDMLVKLDAIFEHKVDKTIYNKMEIYQETGGFFKTSKDLTVVSNNTRKLKGTFLWPIKIESKSQMIQFTIFETEELPETRLSKCCNFLRTHPNPPTKTFKETGYPVNIS